MVEPARSTSQEPVDERAMEEDKPRPHGEQSHSHTSPRPRGIKTPTDTPGSQSGSETETESESEQVPLKREEQGVVPVITSSGEITTEALDKLLLQVTDQSSLETMKEIVDAMLQDESVKRATEIMNTLNPHNSKDSQRTRVLLTISNIGGVKIPRMQFRLLEEDLDRWKYYHGKEFGFTFVVGSQVHVFKTQSKLDAGWVHSRDFKCRRYGEPRSVSSHAQAQAAEDKAAAMNDLNGGENVEGVENGPKRKRRKRAVGTSEKCHCKAKISCHLQTIPTTKQNSLDSTTTAGPAESDSSSSTSSSPPPVRIYHVTYCFQHSHPLPKRSLGPCTDEDEDDEGGSSEQDPSAEVGDQQGQKRVKSKSSTDQRKRTRRRSKDSSKKESGWDDSDSAETMLTFEESKQEREELLERVHQQLEANPSEKATKLLRVFSRKLADLSPPSPDPQNKQDEE
ncbi:hypothetical protein BGZ83_011325 [Gryganskiella cystojenkinii]|nr:hypothetical protein BGZ83_011325 [Gryganskiella cystojenkinii]